MNGSSRIPPMRRFEQLAELARDDAPPAVDLSERVVTQIRDRSAGLDTTATVMRGQPDREWIGLLVGAGIAVTAAAVAVMVGLPAIETMNDPLAGWFEQFDVVMQ